MMHSAAAQRHLTSPRFNLNAPNRPSEQKSAASSLGPEPNHLKHTDAGAFFPDLSGNTHLAALNSSFSFIFTQRPRDVSSLDFVLSSLCLLSHTQTVCVCLWYFISVAQYPLRDEWQLLWQKLMRMQWNKQIVSVRRDKWDCVRMQGEITFDCWVLSFDFHHVAVHACVWNLHWKIPGVSSVSAIIKMKRVSTVYHVQWWFIKEIRLVGCLY